MLKSKFATLMKQIESHCSDLRSMIEYPNRAATDNHVSVPDGFHLPKYMFQALQTIKSFEQKARQKRILIYSFSLHFF